MLFNSLIFLLFLTCFLTLRVFFNRSPLNVRLLFILASSLFFYGWWNIYYVPLLLFTGFVDFAGALAIERWREKRTLFLALSLLANLGVLFYYKYSLFFLQVYHDLFTGKSIAEKAGSLVLPIGLSFYTFQSMSYTIDVYRNRMKATSNPLLFFSFISFFPHLVAGPIVRAKEILPQLARVRITNEVERYHGVKLIVIGYFKKTVLADHLASFANQAFNAKEMANGYDYWWLAVLAFTFQIYFDFSGYSDIARGLAKILGIHFRMNFNHPYTSSSFKQFWSRWHISLSTWFRDYVYIALGGNKKGKSRGIVNMSVTMLVSGFWHGANYTFIVWGGLHAFYLALERVLKLDKLFSGTAVKRIFGVFVVFFCVAIAWVFFRAKNVQQAFDVISKLFSFSHSYSGDLTFEYLNARMILIYAIIVEMFFVLNIKLKSKVNTSVYTVYEIIVLALFIVACLFFRGPGEQFIYFQF